MTMAGSWQHMTTRSGKLRNNESFCGLIENLGDAYEAAEECFGMIQWLAEQLAQQTGASRQHWITEAVRRQHRNEGLRLGGVQRER
jgi:hypothetical protein